MNDGRRAMAKRRLAVAVFVLGSPSVGGTLLVALSFAYLVPRFVSVTTRTAAAASAASSGTCSR